MSIAYDILAQEWREYHYIDGSVVRINSPQTLFIMDDDSHRIMDVDGVIHSPREGWLKSTWQLREEEILYRF
jgi:hypothetical protein